jgi:hypothetical protein
MVASSSRVVDALTFALLVLGHLGRDRSANVTFDGLKVLREQSQPEYSAVDLSQLVSSDAVRFSVHHCI